MNIYFRLYYGAFVNGKKSAPFEQSDKSAAVIAVMFYSTMLFVNIAEVSFLFEIYGFPYVASAVFYKKWIGFLIGILLFVFNYWLFVFKQKYVEIKSKCESETKRQRRGTVLLWVLYVLTSIIMLIETAKQL